MSLLIIVFTNCEKLLDASIDANCQKKLGLKNNNNKCLLDAQFPLGYATELSRFENAVSTHELLVLHDLMTLDNIQRFPWLMDAISSADELIMLVHNNPSQAVKEWILGLRKGKATLVRDSTHTQSGLYARIFHCLLDLNITSKLDGIESILGVDPILEAILELLHNKLLVPPENLNEIENSKEDWRNELKFLNTDSRGEDFIFEWGQFKSEFIKLNKPNPLGQEYVNLLSSFSKNLFTKHFKNLEKS